MNNPFIVHDGQVYLRAENIKSATFKQNIIFDANDDCAALDAIREAARRGAAAGFAKILDDLRDRSSSLR